MSDIQKTIRDYIDHTGSNGGHTLRCFVGMIETGEATLEDFRAVGGDDLAASVEQAQEVLK